MEYENTMELIIIVREPNLLSPFQQAVTVITITRERVIDSHWMYALILSNN